MPARDTNVGARPCPACGELRSEWAFIRAGHPHVRCCSCRTLYVSPLPTGHDEAPPRRLAKLERVVENAQRRARRLAGLGAARVLEIGCREGLFLDAARTVHLDREGLEWRGSLAALAAAKGHRVHASDPLAFEPDRRFDAVVLWDGLGGFVEPLQVLERAHAWLEPEGLLGISAPSVTGVPARIMGRYFPAIDPPKRITLFSHEGIASLLVRASFSPVSWVSQSNVSREEISRALQGATGTSRMGRWLAAPAAAVLHPAMSWLDVSSFGVSFEIYARQV